MSQAVNNAMPNIGASFKVILWGGPRQIAKGCQEARRLFHF